MHRLGSVDSQINYKKCCHQVSDFETKIHQIRQVCVRAFTSCLRTGPVQTRLVRVEFTGNLDSYTTHMNVNSCHWIALDLLFP